MVPFLAECKADNDCPYDKACINENCLNPCISNTCGRGAECVVQVHAAQCRCPAGTQGNPLLSCIAGVCQYNEDCADHEACDRLNRVCRPVCDEDTCAETATCVGREHQPKCECPIGTTGNPFVECTGKFLGLEQKAVLLRGYLDWYSQKRSICLFGDLLGSFLLSTVYN